MSDTIDRQTLWTSPSYRKLTAKRRQLATRIIIEGNTFSQGCKALGLNQTRERANFDLQLCLAEHAPATAAPQDPSLFHFDTPRDEVVAALFGMVDHLEKHGSMDGWNGVRGVSDEAIEAAERVDQENGGKPFKPAQKSSILDPKRVAEFMIELRRWWDEYDAKMRPIRDRHSAACAQWEDENGKPWPWKRPGDVFVRHLPAAKCDGCRAPLAEGQDRRTHGINTVCLACDGVWKKTGTMPTAKTSQ